MAPAPAATTANDAADAPAVAVAVGTGSDGEGWADAPPDAGVDAVVDATWLPGDISTALCASNADCPATGVPCVDNLCAAETGACRWVVAQDGGACDDGEACTVKDHCKAGVCVAGTNACGCKDNLDCAAFGGGNACIGAWLCDVAHVPPLCKPNPLAKVVCPATASPCLANLCNPLDGSCAIQPANDGAACEDGQSCTSGDHCVVGACVGGADGCMCKKNADCADNGDLCDGVPYCDKGQLPWTCKTNPGSVVVCTGVQGPCAQATCNPATGTCAQVPVNQGGGCNDGDPCTQGDACDKGACKGGVDACGCASDADCAASEDGNLCNGTLFCNKAVQPHQCHVNPATVVACATVGDTACLSTSCDAKTGQCAAKAQPDGTACSDGNACTPADLCVKGACVGGTNVCPCQTNADCASKDDGDLCNGTLLCDKSQLPYQCKVNPSSVVVCPSVGDSACATSQCAPTTGKCALVVQTNGAACDADGTACTTGDACANGNCNAGPLVCGCQTTTDCAKFEDGDPCNGTLYCDATLHQCKSNPASVVHCPTAGNTLCSTSVCQPATGKCAVVASNQGLACSDGNDCTVGDACQSGSCVAGPVVCGCNSDSQCAAQEDGNLCNGTLYCDKSALPYHCAINPVSVVVCPASTGVACQTSTCNPATGQCAAVALPDTATCEDGTLCTFGDTCKGGKCAAGTNLCQCQSGQDCAAKDDGNPCNGALFCDKSVLPFTCTLVPGSVVQCDNSGDSPCLTSQCTPATGKCVLTASAEESPCSDGNACTSKDLCAKGKCVGGSVWCDDNNACTLDACSPFLGCQAVWVGQCPDGNPCTADACDAAKGCVFLPAPATCSDGSDCTAGDGCANGQCGGKPVNCDDANSCTFDACVAQGGCVHANTSASCDDGDQCTILDGCAAGVCAGKAGDCDDGNPCTKDGCAATGGCSYVNIQGPCNDGDPCTIADYCFLKACIGNSVSCNDANPCTTDICLKATGCKFTPNAAACSDGDPCTSGDVCAGGSCAGLPALCKDSNPCTDDSCAKGKGCVFLPNTATCVDTLSCTDNDVCSGGVCKGAPKACDDGNPCTKDYCSGDKCYASYLASGSACDDGKFCTVDKCESGGKCVGTPIACAPGAACSEASKVCECLPFYTGDGKTCTVVTENECQTGKANCKAPAQCLDLAAGYQCSCPGWTLPDAVGGCVAKYALAADWTAAGAAVAIGDDKHIVVGGRFGYVAPRTGAWVKVSAATGAVQGALTQLVGDVDVAIGDGSGGFYLGGRIAFAQGMARTGVVHVLSDGTVDAGFNCSATFASPGFGGAHRGIAALALSGNSLYVGGGIATLNGTARNFLGAVDATTGKVLPWSPYANQDVLALAVHAGQVWAGGTFTTMAGVSRPYLAMLHPATGALVGSNLVVDGVVRALAPAGTTLLATGDFKSIGGQSRSCSAQFDAAGALTAFVGPGSLSVPALAVAGDIAYLGGNSFAVGSTLVGVGVVAVQLPTGKVVSTFAPKVGQNNAMQIAHVAVGAGTVYLGGDIGTVDGQPRPFAAAFAADSGALLAWNPRPAGSVHVAIPVGGSVWLGGSFAGAPAAARQALARFDAPTLTLAATPTLFNKTTDAVDALATLAPSLVLGGTFSAVAQSAVSNLATVDAATWAVTNSGAGQGAAVAAVAANADHIVAALNYSPSLLARLDGATGKVTATLGGLAGASSPVRIHRLLLAGSTVFVAGDFHTVAGSPRQGVAAVDLATFKLGPWNANLGAGAKVYGLALSGQWLYLGGQFSSAGGVALTQVARVAVSTGVVDSDFKVAIGVGVVHALAVDASRLYLGGSFASVAGKAVGGFAAVLLGDKSLTLPSFSLTQGTASGLGAPAQLVRDVQVIGGTLHVLGGFVAVDGLPQAGWAAVAL